MSEPSREHIEAVAQCLAAMPDRLAAADRRARHLLTSTDPAVLDAMQDALVRVGRLTEAREMETFFDGFDQIIRETSRTRYVTDWREVEP